MAAKLMHSVQYDRYGGGPEGLKHVMVPIPVPQKGQVLIKIEAVTINPVDWKIQKGYLKPAYPHKFPHIPGTDLAGEIVEVGPGVEHFAVGNKVVAMLGHFYGGGFAEYAVAKESAMAKRPDEVSAAEGAALPVAALTALQALTQTAGIKLDGSGNQTNILITAASGGVGHYAVQLAKLGNTHITATCGARNIEFVKSLGADEVIDYQTPEGAALISPSGKKYDFVIHCAPTEIPRSTFELQLSPEGKVTGFGFMVTTDLNALRLSEKRVLPLLLTFKAENLEYVLSLMKEGKLETVIDSKYPLSRAPLAWAHSISGHATGKIIIEPGTKVKPQCF